VLSVNSHTQADSHNSHAQFYKPNLSRCTLMFPLPVSALPRLPGIGLKKVLTVPGQGARVVGWGISLFSVLSNFNLNTPMHAIPVSLNITAVSRLTNDCDYSHCRQRRLSCPLTCNNCCAAVRSVLGC
jgi:hypothetical protein